MKIKLYVYVLTDARGDKAYDVSRELSDMIFFGGHNKKNEWTQYEAKGRYLDSWIKEKEQEGMSFEVIEKEIEI